MAATDRWLALERIYNLVERNIISENVRLPLIHQKNQKYIYSAIHLNTIHSQFTYNDQFSLAAWTLIIFAELLNEELWKNMCKEIEMAFVESLKSILVENMVALATVSRWLLSTSQIYRKYYWLSFKMAVSGSGHSEQVAADAGLSVH